MLRQQTRRIVDIDQEIEELMARPRHAQILYRRGRRPFWLVNSDGSGNRQLKTEPGQTGAALWIPSGRTLIYLHIPDDPKELITLREHAPDDGTDTLLAKTSQFISASPNADASVFTGASRSRASAYVLILLRSCPARIDSLRTSRVRPGDGASGFFARQPECSVCQRPARQAGDLSGSRGPVRGRNRRRRAIEIFEETRSRS